MHELHHVDKKTTQIIRQLLDQPAEPDNTQAAREIIDYYTKNYDFVQLVTCQSCNSDLCLWILDRQQVQANQHIHHLGLRRIELGDKLLATRKRHDGIMGYQCKCGANTNLAAIEKGLVPTSNIAIPADQPHLEALVKKQMLATNYKPNVTEVDGHTIIEGFKHHTLVNKVQNNAK